MAFVHLHVHSEYSLLDGFSNIKKLVQRAKELEMPAIALTDHGTMFGVVEFYNQAKKIGIKPIIGVEAYLAPNGLESRDPQVDKKSTHCLLLAENQTGYQNLLKLTSIAQLKGFYYYPRIDHDLLAAHSEGLVWTSGCMSAEVPRLLSDGNIEGAKKKLDWYFQVFGKDHFFLELQKHNIPELESINRHLIEFGKHYNAKFIAANDVHYINPEDARLQDIMLAIQTGAVLNDPNRMRMTDQTYYLRSAEEMKHLFGDIPEALSNTLLIAERCEVDLGFKNYHLPHFEVPEGCTPDSYLRSLCEEGLKHKYGDSAEESIYQQRLAHELNVIHQMGFDTYFLIVWDLCRHAREQGIWYNARGSAAGSIVAYTLDITIVDPIEHGLIFERFLNPGRISMPDIDLDFRDDRRVDMMEYTSAKYGDDRVAQIITFGTLGARAAIRDVGRVMGVPLNEVDRIAKMVPNIPGKPVNIQQALDEVPDFRKAYESAPYLKELIDTAAHVEGVVRSAGTHAAGVIIADRPIIDYVPLHRPTGSAAVDSPIKIVTQFEMNIVDSLGLLKVDFLGLATLTIMAKACDLIYQRHNVRYTLANIPTDDPETYELMGRGETAGVFQVEGSGMRRWLMEMKPKELKHVVAMVALFRPGPMDFIPAYIRRMHGEEEINYRHSLLEEIFEETYGFPVYQEQLMFAAMKLAGYTAPEADDLRKAIAKKMPEKLITHRQKFIEGSLKQGLSTETAAEIFSDWEEFARYGFNKSHAVDYAVIAVQTAFLKLHYPVEYMTALLSVTKNDTAKVAFYTADSRRLGVSVTPPEINASEWDFAIEDCPEGGSVIRFALGGVKNVGQGAVETIIEARKSGRFKDINDFARRVDLRQVGKRSLECLTKVGALDAFGPRIALLDSLDRIMAVSASHFRAKEAGQLSLFGESSAASEDIPLPDVRNEISQREILGWERELIGLYVSDHPLNAVMGELEGVISHFSGQLAELSHLEPVCVAGIITHLRNHVTKSGHSMAFVSLEDLQGAIELVIFPRTWESVADTIQIDRIVLVEGKVDMQSGDPKVLVDKISREFTRTVAVDPGRRIEQNKDHQDNASPQKRSDRLDNNQQSSSPKSVNSKVEPSPKGEQSDSQIRTELSDSEVMGDSGFIGNVPPPPEDPPEWLELQRLDATENVNPYQEIGSPDMSREEDRLELTLDERKKSAPGIPVYQEQPESILKTEISEPPDDLQTPPSPDFGEQIGKSMEDLPLQISSAATANEPVKKPPIIFPPQRKSHDSELSGSTNNLHSYLIAPLHELDESGEVKMLTVTLRATGDKTRDVLRLRRLQGCIISYPGEDRYAVQIYERGRRYLVEFPNSTTHICQELLDRLTSMVGSENIVVEPIRFQ